MPTSRDEIAQMNFGYLKGSDLLQFAPAQVLTSQYDKYPELFNQGCSMAYDEIQAELSSKYDITKELSNFNQYYKSATGLFTLVIPAKSYVSRIIATWDTSNYTNVSPTLEYVSPYVKIGTSLGAENIFGDYTNYQKVKWINQYYDSQTTYYFNVSGENVNLDLAINNLSYDQPLETNIYSGKPRNSFFVKIVTIMAIKNILGSMAGENKIIQGHCEWLDATIYKLKAKQMSMTLDATPVTIANRANTISSSFRQLG